MILLKNIAIIILLLFSVQSLKSQIFKNNGMPIVMKPGAKMIVNGNAQNAKGSMTIQANAELRVNGNFAISADTVRFENTSSGIITGDMSIAFGAVFFRNPGSLSIFGIVFNSGILNNLGGIIEIGAP
ncbi:MAG: hypothetical protein V4642_04585 [Bacteroidota bacterium]